MSATHIIYPKFLDLPIYHHGRDILVPKPPCNKCVYVLRFGLFLGAAPLLFLADMIANMYRLTIGKMYVGIQEFSTGIDHKIQGIEEAVDRLKTPIANQVKDTTTEIIQKAVIPAVKESLETGFHHITKSIGTLAIGFFGNQIVKTAIDYYIPCCKGISGFVGLAAGIFGAYYAHKKMSQEKK